MTNMKDIFYLFKNNNIIKSSKDINTLIPIIINENLHSEYYNEDINSLDMFYQYYDQHEGVWFPIDNLLNKNNELINMFIVQEFYAYQNQDWIDSINNYKKTHIVKCI